jgi:hypothetical protein
MKVFFNKGIKRFFSKKQILKTISVFLAFNILLEAVAPLAIFAISGGPSQPETQGFTPIGTSEMVDPFTGDFTYNIPLMDIDGYPINISYRSGVSMEQEASWVGLGWSLNPGVVNRGLRGIPDDFNGDEVIKQINTKPNLTIGCGAGFGAELFGLDFLTLNVGLGIRYNNYSGIGMELTGGANISLKSAKSAAGKCSGGLGINVVSSSDNGLSISPSLSFGYSLYKNNNSDTKLGLSLGCSYNSRAGLQQASYGLNIQRSVSDGANIKKVTDEAGKVTEKDESERANYSKGVGGSFDLGMPTCSPQVNMQMKNSAGTVAVTLGTEIFGIHGNANLKVYYSYQDLISHEIISPAYGYFNSEKGQGLDNAMHDFNREKEGSYNLNTVALPITNYTYDVFSVSGQGVGASYRPFRSDMGHVFDPSGYTYSDSWSAGGEIGGGNLFHGGIDLSLTDVTTYSGRWIYDNSAAAKMKFKSSANYPQYESYYFKEADEKSVNNDPSFLTKRGGLNPVRVKLSNDGYQIRSESVLTDDSNNETPISDANYRNKRDIRNQTISIITRKELHDGLGLTSEPASLTPYDPSGNSSAKGHHIAEITALNTSGGRYVYGIAAYNTHQEETTFAVEGSRLDDGTINYVSSGSNPDNSLKNQKGQDRYFSNTTTPAYAHSYLLTAVLSPDYVDSDGLKGPSDGDIGNFTKFGYEKVSDYQWRTPMGDENIASFNEGLKSISYDDKASYTYGKKDLWYLNKIETKNYIAIFELVDRQDAYGAQGKNGGVGTVPMKMLRKISLYSKRDYIINTVNATPIKEVNFEYDYSLCPNIKNNNGTAVDKSGNTRDKFGNLFADNDPANVNLVHGKLTLKRIWFSYGKSKKAALSPYDFVYSENNPEYNSTNCDRWGNYKPSEAGSGYGLTDPTPNAEYPYAEQNKTNADNNANAWLLNKIKLPSGGTITVNYESDDYSSVQNKAAMQMYKIVSDIPNNTDPVMVLDPGFIEMPFKLTKIGSTVYNDINQYIKGIDLMYFRCFVRVNRYPERVEDDIPKYEYVSGYGRIDKNSCRTAGDYGYIVLKNVKMKDSDNVENYSPISKATTQFARLNLSKEAFNTGTQLDNYDITSGTDAIVQFANAVQNSVSSLNLQELVLGPNLKLYIEGIGRKLMFNKSWMRLNNVIGHKYGGGTRVKNIYISDEWSGMTSNADGKTASYGQEYSYTNVDGTSSGVATYEPQIGGEENPWKQPVYDANNWEAVLAPDDDHYVETPFGECFFPSPSVGYSRVTIKNIYLEKDINDLPIVKNNKSGSVVHEFYTSKDFPTIVKRTEIQSIREKSGEASLATLFSLDVKDYTAVSQGYLVELNDMNGKPKFQKVFQEGVITPISSVEYRYKNLPFENARRLDNSVKVVKSNGIVEDASIGVFSDFVSDMREENSSTVSGGVNTNIDGFMVPMVPPIPIMTVIPIPSASSESTQFRSAVVTKVVQRFGVLEETIAKDLGSTVATKNLAYDAETGEVLVTQTTTNFNDNVYSVTFPAYWRYDGMGAAYKNIGFEKSSVTFTNGFAVFVGAQESFSEGDELSVNTGTYIYKAWVDKVELGQIHAIDESGNPIAGNAKIKVLRSGRRNQQSTPMATITMLSNPLTGIASNFYDKVLQASAIEYSNSWKTYCDCFKNPTNASEHARNLKGFTSNPFILGTKGMYKANKSYLYLSGRTQDNYNNNTNIRTDGLFTSFNPYYKLSSGKWIVDPNNWTFTSEVTEFSPFGAELENRDALGHYSAAVFGYNQSLATAVAANSRYKEVGFDGFEDYYFNGCADNHFKFDFNIEDNNILNSTYSHSGKYSIRVNSSNPMVMNKSLVPVCACNITGSTVDATNFVTYKVQGGKAPYQFSWTCSDSDISIITGGEGNSLIIEKMASGNYSVKLKVEDRNGCTYTKKITIIDGVITITEID